MYASPRKEALAPLILCGLMWGSLSFGQAPTPAPAPGQGPVRVEYTNSVGAYSLMIVGSRPALGQPVTVRLYATGAVGENFPYSWVDASGHRRQSTLSGFRQHIVAGVSAWRSAPPIFNVVSASANSGLPEQTQGIQIFLLNQEHPQQSATSGISDTLAETTLLEVPRIIEIYMSSVAAAAAEDHQRLRGNGTLPPTFTLDQTVELYLRYVVVHEMGHAFGLGHPDADLGGASQFQELLPPLHGRAERPNGPDHPTVDMVYGENPSIMASYVHMWLWQMQSRLQRPVGFSDVNPTARDIAGASRIFNVQLPDAPEPQESPTHEVQSTWRWRTIAYYLTLGYYNPPANGGGGCGGCGG